MGNLDGHEVVYTFGARNWVTGQLTTRLVERARQPARGQRAAPQQRFLQAALARHLRDIARVYPAAHDPRAVLAIDNAPWHRGAVITTVLTALPHLELYRPPSDSPQLQVIDRLREVLRRRAPHNRLFPTNAHLKQALRNGLCSYQTLRHRGLSLIQSPNERTERSAA